jgi:hypothetical protein
MTSEGRKREAAYDTSMDQPQWEAGEHSALWQHGQVWWTETGRGTEPPTRNP